jgi:hypothetical protein
MHAEALRVHQSFTVALNNHRGPSCTRIQYSAEQHGTSFCLPLTAAALIAAAPAAAAAAVLGEAISAASRLGIVKPNNHVVAVQRIHEDFCVKIVSVDAMGAGIKRAINLGGCWLAGFGTSG